MITLTIPIDNNQKSPLYEQIYQYIKDEILGGRLAQAERLPSSRSLAENLQISRSTVNLAYDQLVAEGYLEVVPCKGYFVNRIESPLQLEKERQKVTPIKQFKDEYLYHFTPNGIDMKEFPFRTWSRITKEILSDETKELFALGQPQGEEDLRETICQYLFAARGVLCHREQVIVGAGNDYLLILLQLLLNKDSKIAFENPTYTKAYRILEALGFATETIDMDSKGMKVEELENSGANIAYVMPSHQFPTGIVMSVGRRNELLKWAAQKEDRYLIEDDYDSEFRYRGKPIPALQGMDHNEKIIYIGTFSKAIAPAIRVSYMVLPPSLLNKYQEKGSLISSTVSRIDQKILNEFIRCGAFERHLNRMRKVYKGKHDSLLEALKPFRKKFEIQGDHAGSHILLRAKFPTTEQWLRDRAKQRNVKVYCLSDYILENRKKGDFPPTIILGYAGMDLEWMLKGIQELETAWLSEDGKR